MESHVPRAATLCCTAQLASLVSASERFWAEPLAEAAKQTLENVAGVISNFVHG